MASAHLSAALGAPSLFWFDRFDTRLGTLAALGAVTHTEELGGEDTIEFECADVPGKGDRLLWRDPDDGRWREHVVVRTDEPVDGPCAVYAEASWCDLLGDFIEEKHLTDAKPAAWAEAVLAPTRWVLGEVWQDFGGKSGMLYHVNALEALRKMESTWECECEPEIVVEGGRVARRVLNVRGELGGWRGLRFSYGKNMAGCTRTVLEDEVYTALYGYGAGLPITDDGGHLTGGYRRKLTFGDINDGRNWVGFDDARETWGLWNAGRTEKVHRFGQVTFSDIEDKYELRSRTYKALREVMAPQVSYEVDAALVDGATCPALGDEVAVVDSSRTPEWRMRARVTRRVRELGGAGARVTIGSVRPRTYAAVSAMSAEVATVAETAGAAVDAVVAMDEVDLGEVSF